MVSPLAIIGEVNYPLASLREVHVCESEMIENMRSRKCRIVIKKWMRLVVVTRRLID